MSSLGQDRKLQHPPYRLLWGCWHNGEARGSVETFLPYEIVPTRLNIVVKEPLQPGICPAHSPPSSEYFSVEHFGTAPLGPGQALHVKTWLQNVSETALCPACISKACCELHPKCCKKVKTLDKLKTLDTASAVQWFHILQGCSQGDGRWQVCITELVPPHPLWDTCRHWEFTYLLLSHPTFRLQCPNLTLLGQFSASKAARILA